MSQSHTATHEWQSFELRMRRRRIERCVLQASGAFDAGMFDAALDAVEEAAQLDPYDDSIKALAEKIRTARPAAVRSPVPDIDTAIAHDVPDPVGPTFLDEPVILRDAVVRDPIGSRAQLASEEQRRGRRTWLAAAAVLFLLSGVGGWLWTGSRVESTAPLTTTAQATVATPPSTATGADPVVTEPASDLTAAPPMPAPDAIAQPAIETLAGTTGGAALPSPGQVLDAPLPAVVNASPAQSLGDVTALPAVAPVERASAGAPSGAPSVPTPAALTDIRSGAPSTPDVGVIESSALRAPVGEAVATAPLPVPVAPPAASPAVSNAATPPLAASAPPPAGDERAIRAALSRYESAYNRLDAAAAGSVWPGVDRRALARAFEGLQSQTVSLGDCVIAVTGATARAECRGNARWTPRVGGGTQSAPRRWRFDLRDERGDWIIASAEVRQ